jgi:signal peptidase I
MGRSAVGRRYATVLVEGRSMVPTYSPGDWLMARWGSYRLSTSTNLSAWILRSSAVKVGDVVVVERPEQPGAKYVKRISEIKSDSNQIFVLSDNPEGTDSRQWGWLPTSSIVAKITGRVKRAR